MAHIPTEIFGFDELIELLVSKYNTIKYLKTLKPADIKVCVLLDKIRKRSKKNIIKLDYVGFKIPDTFAIGYGLDYAGKYRNLPFIAKMVKK